MARSRLELDALRTRRKTTNSFAKALAVSEIVTGDASRCDADIEALKRVTPEAVRAFAHRTFVDARRTTVEAYPPRWPEDDAALARHQLYTVLPRDTLASVAARFHVSESAIARANDVDPRYGLSPGQPLFIPPNDAGH